MGLRVAIGLTGALMGNLGVGGLDDDLWIHGYKVFLREGRIEREGTPIFEELNITLKT
jgi:hypothetical protein